MGYINSAKLLVRTGIQALGSGSSGLTTDPTKGPNSDLPHYDPRIVAPEQSVGPNTDLPHYDSQFNGGSQAASEGGNANGTPTVQALLGDRQEILDSGVITAAQAEELARIDKEIEQTILQNTAPILILPEGQVNLPADPVDFIEASELREDKSLWFDDSKGNNADGNPNNDFDPSRLQDLGDNHFLDPKEGSEIIRLGSEDSPIFYEADLFKDPPQVTYHVFYPYNDGPLVQNHEGDWERITINLDPETLQPESVTYSAHGHGTTIPYDEVPTDPETGQPLVYVADGSHANYSEPGSFETGIPSSAADAAPDYLDIEREDLQDHTALDINNDGVVDEADGATVIDTSDQLEPVKEEEWYPEEGNEGVRWGEQGDPIANDILPSLDIPYTDAEIPALGTDGPTGPSTEKGHQETD